MMNSKKTLLLLSLAILALSFTLGVLLYKKSQKEEVQANTQNNADVLVRDYSVKLGATNPKVVLVEFLDPECESCREFYPMVKMLMNEFDGKIQLVVRYAPFHPNAGMMVKILEAARLQNKYWEALEVLFRYQPQWGGHHNPRPELVWTYLPEAGVNIEQIKGDMNSPEIQKILEQDMADVKTLGIRYTPSFFVNGKPLEDFGFEPLKAMIQSELQ